jgi:hypothetical protein
MYAASLQHILAEIERLDLLLRLQVWRVRQTRGEEAELASFYVSEAEADEVLDRVLGAPAWAGHPLPAELRDIAQARLDQLAAEIDQHTAQSLARGVLLRLAQLGQLFGLSEFDLDVILLCLAPELDRGYERLYAYLHDDVTRRRPTVELALRLFCPDLIGSVAARVRFSWASPLRANRLLDLEDDAGSLLGRGLRLDPRVAAYLLEDDSVDDRLRPYARLVGPDAEPAKPDLPDALSQLARQPPDACVLYLQGAYGTGRRAAAATFGRPLLVVAGKRLADADAGQLAELVRLIGREVRLQGALLYWDDFDIELARENDARLEILFRLLAELPGPAFLSGAVTWEPAGDLRGLAFLRIQFSPPGPADRLRRWQSSLGEAGLPRGELADLAGKLADLAGAFRLTGGQIDDAAATARNLALARNPAAPQVTLDDLHAACRLHSNRTLAELAVAVTPHYGWDDIVLPAEAMTQLREIYDQARQRHLVYDTWGFDGKLAMGKGLSVLFAGPPGTGKTMAADVLAYGLGLSLYKIDVSAVVSKYIGETEKNLARIFAEAATSNAILFFDEADALFGKRTQVRDAHDRYANVEISYLLQKMEEYDGIVVLATNLRKNMDEAFVRRLHATVDFPLPAAADRLRIWEQVWPAATPRDPGLDLELLAQRVEVPGGSIRNIALASAFLAAADGGVVTMAHLLHATRREYQKMGKVLAAGELGAR